MLKLKRLSEALSMKKLINFMRYFRMKPQWKTEP